MMSSHINKAELYAGPFHRLLTTITRLCKPKQYDVRHRMTLPVKIIQYPLAFFAGILAYTVAGLARAALDLYLFFPFPPANFDGPAYLWWAYDVSGFVSVYYWTIFYGALFCLFCFGIVVLNSNKLPVRRTLLVATAITILVTATVYFGTGLEQVLDPEYGNSMARNILDFGIFALIGGWYVLGIYLVQRKQKG